MLTLTRNRGEEIVITAGDEVIVVTMVETLRPGRARLGVTASSRVRIDRREVDDIRREESARDPFLPDKESVFGGEPAVNQNDVPTPLVPVARLTNMDAIAAGDQPEIHGRTE